MSRQQIGVLFAACAVFAASRATALTIYSDRTTFNAAVGSVSIFDFNTQVAETPFHTTPLDLGPFTLSFQGSLTAPNTNPGRNAIDVPPPLFAVFAIDGTPQVNVLTFNAGESFFISFDQPISAFGTDVSSINDGQQRTAVWINGESYIPPIGANGQVRFLGFVAPAPFSVVEFRAIANDGYSLDNFAYSAVPEPTVFASTAVAVAMLALRARRRPIR